MAVWSKIQTAQAYALQWVYIPHCASWKALILSSILTQLTRNIHNMRFTSIIALALAGVAFAAPTPISPARLDVRNVDGVEPRVSDV